MGIKDLKVFECEGRRLAREPAPKLFILVYVLILTFACGSKTLTRSKAKSVLEPMVQEQWKLEYGGKWGHETGWRDIPTPLHSVMLSQGLVSPGPMINIYVPSFQLTPAGAKEAAESKWNCKFYMMNGVGYVVQGGGFGSFTCEIPITTKIEIEVMGIQSPNETTAIVDYALTGVPSTFGQKILKAGINLEGEAAPPKKRAGQAMFKLYDNGWRVESRPAR